MPKRNSNDPNVMAYRTLEVITSENQPKLRRSLISEVMAEMGRKGGKKGGKRRLKTMTAEQRSQVALKAAQARWSKKR
jgi:hypothetical protein